MSDDTLTITDNRTGKTYKLPIENGAIRAIDLRQIKTDENDFGLMTYDPGFLNTASCQSRITFIDGDRGILDYRGYPIEQLAEKMTELSEKEKLVISLFYKEELTLTEIGQVLNLSTSRISQIHSKALFKLKHLLDKAIQS